MTHWRTPHTDGRLKARYQRPGYPTLGHRWWGLNNFHHVLNLFVAYRWERDHPARIVETGRYRAWRAKRDGADT